MERRLWEDIAQYYHAGLRNVCGPFDRSYGMDMTRYLALLGLWIATVVPPEQAPLPDVDAPFDHAADFFYMPVFALLGTRIPSDLVPQFQAFSGERQIERVIETDRVVTAWLGETIMLGGEADRVNTARSWQYHPLTVHWRAPDGSIGWIRSHSAALIRATASEHRLELSGEDPMTWVFEINVAGADPAMIQGDRWVLPGLTVQVHSDGAQVSLEGSLLTVQFSSASPLMMEFA